VPELPEVEAARLIARRVAVGRRIAGVRCADDRIVFEAGPVRVRRALLGARVRDVRRHGKHLWLVLDRRPWPVIHFGMTGGFFTPRGAGTDLVAYGRKGPRGPWPPRFAKLVLRFDDGGELAYADPRRLGRVRLRHDPPSEPPISLLGFDALLGLPSPARFVAEARGRRAPIKAVLLDQSFAAGVGNWIADEVLYQARIDPRRRAHTLTGAEARRLRAALRRVIATSVAARNDSDRYPRTWLFHHRWGRNAAAVTARGEAIRHITIAGRTTAWVPSVQR
jgi:formamidopyrimidine-DNA glycosylase